MIDAGELRARSFSSEALWAAYRAHWLLRTEATLLDVIRALLPLAAARHWAASSRRDLFRADDVFAVVTARLWRRLRRPSLPMFQSRAHCAGYWRAAVRRDLASARTEVDRGLDLPDGYQLPPLRDEGSVRVVELRIFLAEELPRLAEREVLRRCRFGGTFPHAARYAVRCYLSGRVPSPYYIQTLWREDAELVVDWVLVRLRLALSHLRERYRNFLHARNPAEFVYDPGLRARSWHQATDRRVLPGAARLCGTDDSS